MSDLFHEAVPLSYIQSVFSVMCDSPQHIFQVLTKRSERLAEVASNLDLASNIWIGVSVENQAYTSRIDDLRTVPAALRFLSIEPLLGPIKHLNLDGIGWVIVGGESGCGARAIDPSWVRQIRDYCIDNHVAFFFKQWGGVRKSRTGRLLDGRTWEEMPQLPTDLNKPHRSPVLSAQAPLAPIGSLARSA
jgi:protein gp37